MTPSSTLRPVSNVLDLIGNTPIVKLSHFDTGLCSLYAKLENQNPGGSIKDRIALKMIEVAEQEGKLKPGGTIVEATAGNTGLGLALVAFQKGYRLILVIPDKMSKEKMAHLRAMGAQIVMTRSDVGKGHPDYYQDLAESIAEREGAFYVNQFGNAANPLAHELSTGPEIWEQMNGQVDAIVCAVGSSGTLTGLSRYFAKVSPQTEIVLADPAGSILVHYVETGEVLKESGSWLTEGIGEDFIPSIADFSRVRAAYTVNDQESFDHARELLLREGILGGSSTGTLLAAALRYCREQSTPKNVVTFVCDSGNKYLSKMFNDQWLMDQGFIERPKSGTLRDVISRLHDDRATVVVGPEDTLNTAITRMKLYDVSQLPVIEGDKIVGIVDESDLLLALIKESGAFRKPVRKIMTHRLVTVTPETQIEALLPVLDQGLVVIVEDQGRFLGLITRMDLINHLRLQLR